MAGVGTFTLHTCLYSLTVAQLSVSLCLCLNERLESFAHS